MDFTTTAKGAGPRIAAIPRYLSAVLSQGLVSGFHFVLNLVLVKLLVVADFGIYALTFVLAVMATAVSNALITTPLCIFGPASSNANERRQIETMLTTLMAFLLGTSLVMGLLGSFAAASRGVDLQVLIAALGFVVAYLARQYSRGFGYARFDVIAVLYGDITYVVTGIVLFTAMSWSGETITVVEVFTVLTISNGIAVVLELVRLPSVITFQSLRSALFSYRTIWLHSRWALVGAVTTVLVSQAHSLVVSSIKGPAAYAPLAAGFVIFGPVRVVFSTIQNVIKPEMSLAITQRRSHDARKQMLLASAISVAAIACLSLLTLVSWPYLDQWLFKDQYADAPMEQIVLLWACITLVAALQNGPFAALQSLQQFQPLALVTVYGSIISLVLVSALMLIAPIHWSDTGILVAEVYVAVYVMFLSLNTFRQLEHASSEPKE